MDPLFVLTRTSGRPEFFKRCRESVKALNYPNVVHIVHSDDPRNEQYIECDILIRGEVHGNYMGTAPYNLYNNRLLEAVPEAGWIHFLDDDDRYVDPGVFDWIDNETSKDKMHVVKVKRWNETVWPRNWKKQRSFQTECFVLWVDVGRKAKWWSDKGGDHYYTRQITREHKISWHDVLVAEAQEGKGHGKLVDLDGGTMDFDCFDPHTEVFIKMTENYRGKHGGKLYSVEFFEGRVLEKYGFGRITYKGTEVVVDTNCLIQNLIKNPPERFDF